jgi:hypothetical protein
VLFVLGRWFLLPHEHQSTPARTRGACASGDGNRGLEHAHEAVAVLDLALIEAERLLVHVGVKVLRLHADVRALDRPLEQRPRDAGRSPSCRRDENDAIQVRQTLRLSD